MPAVQEAYALDAYFNSGTTDAPVTPVPATGLAVPAGWGVNGQGVPAWRSEWRVWNPGASVMSNPYWSPGVTKVIAPRTHTTSHYFGAAGQVFTINLWDLAGPSSTPASSTATDAILEMTAYYLDSNNQPVFIQPPFAQYCWGGYSVGATLYNFPALLPTQNYVALSQAAGPMPSVSLCNPVQTGPLTTQKMNVAALASLIFSSPIAPPPVGQYLRLQVAVYLTLTSLSGASVQCFDDPEMDVDCGN